MFSDHLFSNNEQQQQQTPQQHHEPPQRSSSSMGFSPAVLNHNLERLLQSILLQSPTDSTNSSHNAASLLNSTAMGDRLFQNNVGSSLFNDSHSPLIPTSDNYRCLGLDERPLASSVFGLSLPSKQATQYEKFESQINLIQNEIQGTIQKYVDGLQQRKDHLIGQLEAVRKVYAAIYQMDPRNGSPFQPSLETIPLPNISFTKPDVTLFKAVSSIGYLTVPAFGPCCTIVGDGIEATTPGLNSSFMIHTKTCFEEDLMTGRGNIAVKINPVIIGNQSSNGSNYDGNHHSPSLVDVPPGFSSPPQPSSYSSAVISHGQLSPPIASLSELLTKSVCVTDHNNGKYTVSYSLPVFKTIPTFIEILVMVNGLPVTGSPFKVVVKQAEKSKWTPVMNYGTEGSAMGQLCRPWGVAIARMPVNLICSLLTPDAAASSSFSMSPITPSNPASGRSSSLLDDYSMTNPQSSFISPNGNNKSYLVAVADRSNNRIQLFHLDMDSLTMTAFNAFGSGPGTRNGQFDRPAGICFNLQMGHVIVADKDNHRIQVFDLRGNFLFKFGEKGSRAGQFCYPWDVDSCSSSHEIAVSDTRNHRVQLFDSSGRYLSYFAQPMDSPRGVTFLHDNKLLVSDFNKHRLLIFDRKSSSNHGHQHHLHSSAPTTPTPPSSTMSPRSIGFGEGTGWGEFLRPQGTSFGGNYIFCSDSRNNRIAIYNLMNQTFEYLTDDLNLDRPSGIAVIDQVLIVVDFGNNRLQIFRK